jgi:hypothetical protein
MWEPFRKFLYGPVEAPPPPPAPVYDPTLEPPPLGDAIRRGEAAIRLLGDPTLAEAFHEIRVEVYQNFVGSKPQDQLTREEAYRVLQALELVRSKLIHYRDTARMRQAAA